MNLNKFINELKKINIDITEEQLSKLDIYYNLLITENEKYNLTNITEKESVYLKHFYDSLTLNKIIDLKNIDTLCDIGTGAGFPGMVIKIVFPKIKVTLVDSLNKRINFLKMVSEKLNLNDITIVHERAEEFSIKNKEQYDVVTARAVAHLSNLLEYSIQSVKVDGYFIAMKAQATEELNESKNAINLLSCSLDECIEFNLPIEESKRTLIKIKKDNETSNKYPRKYSEIKKKRL